MSSITAHYTGMLTVVPRCIFGHKHELGIIPENTGAMLDLTGGTPFDPEIARMLNEVAVELRPSIVELTDRMSLEQGSNIDWWVTPLASRNPFSSRFFLNCCRITLLDRLLKLQKVAPIVLVDSPAMADLVSRLANRHGAKLGVKVLWLRYWRDWAWQPIRNLLVAIFHMAMSFMAARLLLPRPVSHPVPLILVDTFLYQNSIRNGIFHDRHFPGIAGFLTEEERARLRYFPTFYKIKNYPKIFFRLRGLRDQFFFKEDFLTLGDYFYALWHGFRMRRIKPARTLVLDGLPVDGLMREDLHRGWMWPSAIEALLKYRAIFRMSEDGIRIGRVLDWFENQDIDRGANAGYRRYYPNTEVVGYVGYVASQHYLCVYPSSAEEKARVLPTRFAVMGRGSVDTVKEFCPNLIVGVAPALRYSVQPPLTMRSPVENELFIVVALPAVRAEALELLDAIRHLLHVLHETPLAAVEVHVRIKPHPTSDIQRAGVFEFAPGSKIRVTWEDEKLDSLLQQADVLVSAASSACFEALTMGVPVVVFGSCHGLTYVLIPQTIPQGRWQLCYSREDVLSAIMAFRALRDAGDENLESARLLRDKYMEPVSRQGVRYLMLGNET